MKFQMSTEQKKEAYATVKIELEKSLILRLTVLGIDAENFDENTFIPAENSTAEKDIYAIIQKIKEIDQKISIL